MLRGELNTRGNLRGDLTGGIFYGTNDYDDLINKPQINGVTLSGNKTSADLGIFIPTKTSDLTNDSDFVVSSDLATVATTGDYDDLINKPVIPAAQVNSDWEAVSGVAEILNKPVIPTRTSQLTNDSGYATTGDIPTKLSDLQNDTDFVELSDLAAVATTGDYDDLINKPVIPAAQVNSDWEAVSGVAEILNKPTIPSNTSDLNNDSGFVSYTDLTGTLLTGATSITLSDASITTTSTIDIYTDVFGIQPTNAVVASGSITLTFLAQASDITVKVRVS